MGKDTDVSRGIVQSCGYDHIMSCRNAQQLEQTGVMEEKTKAVSVLPLSVAEVKIAGI